MRLMIEHANIVTEHEVIEDGYVMVEDEKITSMGSGKQADELLSKQQDLRYPTEIKRIDAGGSWLLPGFIDIHVHGGNGADFMNADSASFDQIASFHLSQGTTSLLATTMTAPQEHITQVLQAISDYQQHRMRYAQVIGVHLEGPFLSPKRSGAQHPAYMVFPQLDWMKDWQQQYPGIVQMVTLAPELPGGLELITWLSKQGIVPACGHSDASYSDMQQAIDAGLKHVVHAFNAMSPLHHREPGVVGALLTNAKLSAEIIADGHHVHPAVIDLLVKLKSPDRLILISDAIAAAGMPDGDYQLGGLDVKVEQGVARLKERSHLAGSVITMLDAFRYIINTVGVSIIDASRYASANPAILLHKDHRMGSIATGKQADLLMLDASLRLQGVWIKGEKKV
jgi:N-acetylglucosamine-6-phosphate deacetylase